MGVGSWPWRRARIAPDRVALLQGEESLTYGELARRVDVLAGYWQSLGVRHGDRVAYLGPNDIATFECLFAAGRLGAVLVPLNIRLAPPEIEYMLRDCGASVLVWLPESKAVVDAVDLEAAGVEHVLSLEQIRTEPAAGQHPFTQDEAVTLDDGLIMLYTSGTTGRPKGAVLTHGNITWNTMNQLAHLDIASTDVGLCAAPLFHVAGLGMITMPLFFKGGTVRVAGRFDPAEFLATIERDGITCFPGVPTMLQMMCEHPRWTRTDVSSLRYVIFGGSLVLERVAKAWLDRGVAVQQGYGMTETSPGVFLALPDGASEHPVSCGVPHFFTDSVLQTAVGERLTGAGEGELLVRGHNVFSGYWNRPEETAASFTEDGWFRTGDVVRIDEDGWAYVVDRVKDMIISGGENIYPAEVETVICEVDGVGSAAVVGTPDDRWGEVGHAYVVPLDGRTVDPQSVRDHLEGRLARYKIPRRIEVVDDLPRNAAGKILRKQLRERARGD